MEFRQLEALKYVVELESFSEAAKQMSISQPSVSSQIIALEHEFGCPLLVRRPSRTTPTEHGKALYRYAVDILAMRDKAVASCGRHMEMSGVITIAASTLPYQFVLPVLTAEFSLKHPDANFRLVGGDSISVAQEVLAGSADLGLVGTRYESTELEYVPFMEDSLVMVAPATEPYTHLNEETLTLEDLFSLPFITREEGSGTRVELGSYIRRHGYDEDALRVVAQMDNPDAIMKAVEQGLGFTILSSLAAADFIRNGKVLVFNLPGNLAKRKIYLVWARNRRLSTVSETFLRFAARYNDIA